MTRFQKATIVFVGIAVSLSAGLTVAKVQYGADVPWPIMAMPMLLPVFQVGFMFGLWKFMDWLAEDS